MLEDGCVVSPAGLGQVDGLVAGPMLGDELGANPQGPGAGDALDSDIPGLGEHVARLPERELSRLGAEVALSADGCVLLVEAPGYHVLLCLEKTTDVQFDGDN